MPTTAPMELSSSKDATTHMATTAITRGSASIQSVNEGPENDSSTDASSLQVPESTATDASNINIFDCDDPSERTTEDEVFDIGAKDDAIKKVRTSGRIMRRVDNERVSKVAMDAIATTTAAADHNIATMPGAVHVAEDSEVGDIVKMKTGRRSKGGYSSKTTNFETTRRSSDEPLPSGKKEEPQQQLKDDPSAYKTKKHEKISRKSRANRLALQGVVNRDDSGSSEDPDAPGAVAVQGIYASSSTSPQTILVANEPIDESTTVDGSTLDRVEEGTIGSNEVGSPIVAELVPDEGDVLAKIEREVVERLESEREKQVVAEATVAAPNKTRYIKVGLIGLVVIIGAIVAGIVRGARQGNEPGNEVLVNITDSPTESMSPTMVPTASPTRYLSPKFITLMEILGPDVFGDNYITFFEEDWDSPQYQAVDWLANRDMYEPNVNYTASEIKTGLLERYALAVLYYATGGNTTWNVPNGFMDPTKPHCEWGGGGAGVFCLYPDNSLYKESITHLVFRNKFMRNSLPSEIGLLTSLALIDFADNPGLTGTIPEEIYALTEMRQFFLSGSNGIKGTMSPGIGNWTNLRQMWIDNSGLSGTIPSEFTSLTNLRDMIATKCGFTGHIPTEISKLSRLTIFHLDENSLSGTIPTELGSLTNMEYLFLDYNNLLSGTIPTEVGKMKNLISLRLHGNRLNGTIPRELYTLEQIIEIYLGEQALTGILSSEIGLMDQIVRFHMQKTDVGGTVPTELGNLTECRFLHLNQNNFTGTIPSQIELLQKLETFDIEKNLLSSTIPTVIGFMTQLRELHFDVNTLTGNIPSEIGLLTRLTRLDLDDNEFTGSIPSEFGSLGELTALNMYRNSLNGTLPSELAKLSSSLWFLSFFGNDFTGTVPSEYSELSLLRSIRLNGTMLTGNVSSSFCIGDDNGSTATRTKYDKFYMDCVNVDGQPREIECSCCTHCCDDNECKFME